MFINIFNRRHFLVNPSHAPLLLSISLFCVRESLVILLKRCRTILIILPFLFSCIYLIEDIERIDKIRLVRNITRQRYIISFYWLVAAETFAFLSLICSWMTKRTWAPAIGIAGILDGVPIPSALRLRLINSALLLSSSVTITYSHISLTLRSLQRTKKGLIWTIVLRCLFLRVQWTEFSESAVTISDRLYRSLLFACLRFHGIHVLVRVVFLAVAYWRVQSRDSTTKNHPTYICSVIYWHFVDVVWVFVYFSFYLVLHIL